MEEIRIRPATIEDVGLILHHRTAMFSDMGDGDAALALMRPASEAFLQRALVDGTYRGWLAVAAGGRVVAGGGVAIVPWPGSPADPAPRRGWIQNIYTEPEFRHRGIARRIMEAIVAWCRAEGFVPCRSTPAHSAGRCTNLWGSSQPTRCGYIWTGRAKLPAKRKAAVRACCLSPIGGYDG